MFEYAPEIRKIIDTTNTTDSVNSVLRRSVKTKGSFPSDDAAKKILHPERLTTPNLSYTLSE